MDEVVLAATADIHSPRYISLYRSCLEKLEDRPKLVVFVGDIVEKNNISAARLVFDVTKCVLGSIEVVACFGNEEYRGFEDRYRELYPWVKWVDDEAVVVEIDGVRIGFIGTRGALDKPTPWQQKNIPNIANYYRELPEKIRELAINVRDKVDYLVLISHYGVTYKTLIGEPRRIWVYLASKSMESIIKPSLFDLVLHGHAHNSTIDMVYVNNVPVYNVSLPSRKRIVLIRLGKRKVVEGLLKWM